MNEEDMKAFVESYTNTKMNENEWDSYQKEEDIHKNLYNEIYEEVMELGMDNKAYPKMFSLHSEESEDIFTFCLTGEKNPIIEIFINGDFNGRSGSVDYARGMYVRLRKEGFTEYTEPVRGVYAYYRNMGRGPKLGNNAYGSNNYAGDHDYALNA